MRQRVHRHVTATDEKPHLREQTSEEARALANRKVVVTSGDANRDMMVGMMQAPAQPKA